MRGSCEGVIKTYRIEGETLRRQERRKALHGSQANVLGHTLCSAPGGEGTLEAKFSYRPSEFSQRPSEFIQTLRVQSDPQCSVKDTQGSTRNPQCSVRDPQSLTRDPHNSVSTLCSIRRSLFFEEPEEISKGLVIQLQMTHRVCHSHSGKTSRSNLP